MNKYGGVTSSVVVDYDNMARMVDYQLGRASILLDRSGWELKEFDRNRARGKSSAASTSGSFISQGGWPKHFPRVKPMTSGKKLKNHPDYEAAKAGNTEAANNVVFDLVKRNRIAELGRLYPHAKVVPVLAQEAAGRNKLPAQFAMLIAELTNLDVEYNIGQSNRAYHTGADAAWRFISRAKFKGKVEEGRDYIIADDFVTMGGTISELRRYIESKGGRVVAATSLAVSGSSRTGYSGDLAQRDATIIALRKKFANNELHELLKENGIYGGNLQSLTNSEGRWLLSFSGIESLRIRLSDARNEGKHGIGETTVPREIGERERRAKEKAGVKSLAVSPITDTLIHYGGSIKTFAATPSSLYSSTIAAIDYDNTARMLEYQLGRANVLLERSGWALKGFNRNQPRGKSGPGTNRGSFAPVGGMAIASPHQDDQGLSYTQAIARINSPRHQVFLQVMDEIHHAVGLKPSHVIHGAGMYQHAGENISAFTYPEPDENGDHAIHHLEIPEGKMQQAFEAAEKNLTAYTLMPDKENPNKGILIIAENQYSGSLSQTAEHIAKTLSTQRETILGTVEFLGDPDDRTKARENLRREAEVYPALTTGSRGRQNYDVRGDDGENRLRRERGGNHLNHWRRALDAASAKPATEGRKALGGIDSQWISHERIEARENLAYNGNIAALTENEGRWLLRFSRLDNARSRIAESRSETKSDPGTGVYASTQSGARRAEEETGVKSLATTSSCLNSSTIAAIDYNNMARMVDYQLDRASILLDRSGWELKEFDRNRARGKSSAASTGGSFISTGNFRSVSPREFVKARNQSKRMTFLSEISTDDLKEHRLFLAHGGKVGYALDKHGDLQNVFNNGGPKGADGDAIIDAIKNGAKTLDCFSGYLSKFYARYGFVPTGYMKFNDDFAPKDWDYEQNERPDIIFMAYQGGDRATIEDRVGTFNEPLQTAKRYYTDWDSAKADSRTAAMGHDPDGQRDHYHRKALTGESSQRHNKEHSGPLGRPQGRVRVRPELLSDVTDTLIHYGGSIKTLEETGDCWRFGGWLVVFGSHDASRFKDKFTAQTDFDIEDGERRGLYYNHGLDGTIKRTKLGDCRVYVKAAGVWIEGQIRKRTDYLKSHAEKIAANIESFGLSSGAPAHLVERKAVPGGHEILLWPLAEASITPTPAEPLTGCFSLKALVEAGDWGLEAGVDASSRCQSPASSLQPQLLEAGVDASSRCQSPASSLQSQLLEAGVDASSRCQSPASSLQPQLLEAGVDASSRCQSPASSLQSPFLDYHSAGLRDGLAFDDHCARVLAAVGELQERVDGLAQMRCVKSGRLWSAGKFETLGTLADGLGLAAGQIRAVAEEYAPGGNADEVLQALARFEALRARMNGVNG